MKCAIIPYGANIIKNKNHLTLSPLMANMIPTDAAAQSSPYRIFARLHAKNMQNAAKYSGIKLKGKYAQAAHIITDSAVQTAAVVSFLADARITCSASPNKDSRSSSTRNNT